MTIDGERGWWIARTTAYGLMVVAGAVLPSQVGDGIPFKGAWLLMCLWLVIGGLASGAGQISGRWVGEYVGMPLLVTALFGFGILQGALGGWYSLPSVALLWAFVGILLARWRDVAAVFRAQREVAAG